MDLDWKHCKQPLYWKTEDSLSYCSELLFGPGCMATTVCLGYSSLRNAFCAIKKTTYAKPRLNALAKELQALMRLPDNNHVLKYFSVATIRHGYLLVSMEICICSVQQSIFNQVEYFKPVDLMLHITTAVEFLHKEKIIHRNLKPSNILITKNANVGYVAKLSDVGSCSYFYTSTLGTPVSGEIAEYPLWQAPEILAFVDSDLEEYKPVVVSSLSTQLVASIINGDII